MGGIGWALAGLLLLGTACFLFLWLQLRRRVARLAARAEAFLSSEEPPLPPLPGAQQDGETPAASRRTVPASNAFVPAACGLVVGGEAVKDLLRAAGVYRGTWHEK